MRTNVNPTVTYCIGRHLIDIPSSYKPAPVVTGIFQVQGAARGAPAIDIVVTAMVPLQQVFDAVLAERQQALTQASMGNVDELTLARRLSEKSFLFRVRQIDDAYTSELHLWEGKSHVSLKLDSFKNSYESSEATLLAVARGITSGRESPIPGRGTFCLGPVHITGDFATERGEFSFRNERGEVLQTEIDSFASNGKTPLHARMKGPTSLLSVFNVDHQVIRAAERTVAGMHAQEWLGSAKLSDDDDRSFSFVLETIRQKPGKNAPLIRVTFDTSQPLADGQRAKTTISKDEAIQLWEKVIGSVRSIDVGPQS